MNYNYYIGVDPGTNTAIALWDSRDNKLEYVNTYKFWEAISALELWFKDEERRKDTLVVIEDCIRNKPTFGRENPNMNRASLDRKAQNVGMVKRDTKLLLEYCQYNGLDYLGIVPRKSKKTKKWVQQFCTKVLNEHEIDAAHLVIGR